MDPDAALAGLRSAMAKLREEYDSSTTYERAGLELPKALDNFEALDGWLSRGGFLPRAWKQHG